MNLTGFNRSMRHTRQVGNSPFITAIRTFVIDMLVLPSFIGRGC